MTEASVHPDGAREAVGIADRYQCVHGVHGVHGVDGIHCDHCGLPVPRARITRSRSADNGDARQAVYCCFGCRIAREVAAVGQSDVDGALAISPVAGGLFARLGMGVFLTLNIMVFRWQFYAPQVYGQAAAPGELDALAAMLSYFMMFLTTVVMALLWVPLASDAVMNVRDSLQWSAGAARESNGSARSRGPRWRLPMFDMNMLIVVGTLAAYAVSVVHTLTGASEVYYETAAMILILVTLGGYLDASVKKRAAGATMDLLASIPQRVHVRADDVSIEVEVAELEVGQIVRIAPGEAAACDGQVVEGGAWVDESSLTGESRLRSVAAGDRILAGSVSTDGLLWIQAQRVGVDRTIDQVRRLLDEARLRQPGIARLADRVAGVFIPLVMTLAVGVFVFHACRGQAVRGLMDGLCVLLISCPCALGLAAPLATWSALARAARLGLAIDSGATLERAARVSHVFMDKTGTLTQGVMTLDAVFAIDELNENEAIALAAAIEESSPHPIARAIVEEAQRRELSMSRADSVRILPGAGVEARVAGCQYQLGGVRLLKNGATGLEGWPAPCDAATRVYLLRNGQPIACFDLTERVRDEASACLAAMHAMGLTVEILTGDQRGPAERLAGRLGLSVRANLLPADKLAAVESARSRHDTCGVAMIGDGVNDAPVLAAADVGVAVAGGTDLAHQAGNVRLFAGGLDRAALLFAIARHAMGRIRLNLVWAFGYNTLGLTLAVAGYLSPVFSAVAMFGSSVMIIVTSKNAGNVTLPGQETPEVNQKSVRVGEVERADVSTGSGDWNEPIISMDAVK